MLGGLRSVRQDALLECLASVQFEPEGLSGLLARDLLATLRTMGRLDSFLLLSALLGDFRGPGVASFQVWLPHRLLVIRLQHALATRLPNLLLDELLLDLSLGQSPQKVLFLVLEDLLRQWLALVDRGLHWRLSG